MSETKTPENPELQEAIEDVKETLEAHDKALGETDDVKEGNCTKEDEAAEPANVLFRAISELTIQILADPVIDQSFAIIDKNLNALVAEDPKPSQELKATISKEIISTLINIIAVSMSHSAYNSLLLYDDLIKKELDNQFDHVGKHLNTTKADVEGLKALSQIFRRQISDINKKLDIEDITAQILTGENIQPESPKQ